MLRLVHCDQQGALLDCPVVPVQLLREDPSLKRVWACVLGPVLPDGDSAAVSSQPWKTPLSRVLCVVSAGASFHCSPQA